MSSIFSAACPRLEILGYSLFLQLFSYGVLGWAVSLLVAFCAARFGGLLGMIAGHLLVAVVVGVLDVRCVSAAKRASGWDGSPDIDIVFTFGWFIRVLLINTLLLVVSVPALRVWQRHRIMRSHPSIA